MLAHAIDRTAPIAPMSTQSVVAMLPTRSSFNGRTFGAIRRSVAVARDQIASMRATSALATASVTPGLKRAIV
jgi:hypothetical protein